MPVNPKFKVRHLNTVKVGKWEEISNEQAANLLVWEMKELLDKQKLNINFLETKTDFDMFQDIMSISLGKKVRITDHKEAQKIVQ